MARSLTNEEYFQALGLASEKKPTAVTPAGSPRQSLTNDEYLQRLGLATGSSTRLPDPPPKPDFPENAQRVPDPELGRLTDIPPTVDARPALPAFEFVLPGTPDEAARTRKTARKLGMPTGLVRDNLTELERRGQMISRSDFELLQRQAPTVAGRMKDPVENVILTPDAKKLTAMEQTWRMVTHAPEIALSAAFGVAGAASGLLESLSAVPAELLDRLSGGPPLLPRLKDPLDVALREIDVPDAYDLSKVPVVPTARPFDPLQALAERFGGPILPENPLQKQTAKFAEISDRADRLSKVALGDTMQGLGSTAQGVVSGITSFTEQAPVMVALASLGPVPVLTYIGLVTSGHAAGEGRRAGLDPVLNLTQALAQGAIEIMTGRGPTGALFESLRAGSGLVKSFVNTVLREVPGEQVATLAQDYVDWITQHPEKTLDQYLAERPNAAWQTLVATLVGTGGNVALTQGVERLLGRRAMDPAARERVLRETYALGALEDATQSRIRGIQRTASVARPRCRTISQALAAGLPYFLIPPFRPFVLPILGARTRCTVRTPGRALLRSLRALQPLGRSRCD